MNFEWMERASEFSICVRRHTHKKSCAFFFLLRGISMVRSSVPLFPDFIQLTIRIKTNKKYAIKRSSISIAFCIRI